MFALPLEKVGDAFFAMVGSELGGLVFRPSLTPAEVIEANVGYDAVEPGVEAAFKAEAVEIPIDFEKGFLIDVPRILRPAHHVQRQAQDVAIVEADKFLESGAVARLGFGDQGPFVNLGQRCHRWQGGINRAGPACLIGESQRPTWKRRVMAKTIHYGRTSPLMVSSRPPP